MDAFAKRFVYILESIKDPQRHYVGLTSDVVGRVAAHNNGAAPHTSTHRPWKLNVCLEFAGETLAAKFERYLKTGSGRAFTKRHFG